MQHAEFKMNLELYGTDIKRWPQETQFAAQRALSGDPALKALLEAERVFELQAARAMPASDQNFAHRIAQAALLCQPVARVTLWGKLRGALRDLDNALPLPHPAYALAVLALLGFFMGTVFQAEDNLSGTNFAETMDTMLYETGAIL